MVKIVRCKKNGVSTISCSLTKANSAKCLGLIFFELFLALIKGYFKPILWSTDQYSIHIKCEKRHSKGPISPANGENKMVLWLLENWLTQLTAARRF